MITLERATADELATITRFDTRPQSTHTAELREIGRRLARWCADRRNDLAAADPDLPPGVVARRADKWRPFFILAECAGGEWPRLARQACAADNVTSKLSTSLQLLADIRAVFKPAEEKIETGDLIERLSEIEESPWSSYNFKERNPDEKRIRKRQISGLLRDYRIESATVWINGRGCRGYQRDPIEKACRRYLPSDPPDLCVRPLGPRHEAVCGVSSPLGWGEKSNGDDRAETASQSHPNDLTGNKPPHGADEPETRI